MASRCKTRMLCKIPGCNDYSNNNPYVRAVYVKMLELIKRFTVDSFHRASKQDHIPVHIVDFGTADGAGFFSILKQMMYFIRAYCPVQQVHITLEDLPDNDYVSVLKNISCLSLHEEVLKGIHIAYIGTSFYEQCFPDNSVTMGMSSTSVHWLCKRPCLTNGIFSTSAHKDRKDIFAKQAEADWERFLICRERELIPGGVLVILVPGTDEQGRYSGYTRKDACSIFELMTNQWIMLASKGIISKHEQENATVPLYLGRVENDFKRPFINECSAVYKSSLHLVHLDTWILEAPYYNEFLASEDTNEGCKVYAEQLVNSLQSWTYSFLYDALNPNNGNKRNENICNMYYNSLKEIIMKDPHRYNMDYVYYCIIVKKNV